MTKKKRPAPEAVELTPFDEAAQLMAWTASLVGLIGVFVTFIVLVALSL